MSEQTTLGQLVRQRRLESGYSLGQLASKVGQTAAAVRSWERDVESPDDVVLTRLAETLEIDIAEIRRLTSEAIAPDEDPAATLDVAATPDVAATLEEAATPEEAPTPDVAAVLADAVAPTAGAESESLGSVAAAAADVAVEIMVPVEPTAPVEAPVPTADEEPGPDLTNPWIPVAVARGSVPDEEADRGLDLLDAPTEAIPLPPMPESAAPPKPGRGAVAVLEPMPRLPVVEPAPDGDPGLLRYFHWIQTLFDPHKRYLYWIRAALTVIVLGILGIILLDKVGELLDAIKEVLDSIEPTKTGEVIGALGAISR